MKRLKLNDDQFTILVKNSKSIADVLRGLQIAPKGGNYRTVNRRIVKLKIDTSHFTGQLWSKGYTIGPKRLIGEYLSNKYKIGSYALCLRLIREGIKQRKCEKCHLEKWLEDIIPLELHHIDGNSENNNLSNLQILCPNCHAQTDNYRGKNKKAP